MDYLKPRQWKLRLPQDLETWDQKITDLQASTGLSALTLRVCLLRGLDSAEAVLNYLNPKLENLTDPFLIQDMQKAVDRLAKARAASEKILIYGDYDVDGTTGAALLSWVFKDFGFQFSATQPDRFRDGYGLNVQAVEKAHAEGFRLFVTVDCGISSHAAATRAKELGIDLIILDHHQILPDKGLPDAWAICNPQRADCKSGLKQLCGCGVAFYLCMALRNFGRAQGWFAASKEPNLKQHLDLVVMATAADQVPLTGDNRILVSHGLSVLKQSAKPGVRALLEVAGVAAKSISPGHLGFVIGPRINASGRIGSASTALEMLTTSDAARGVKLAHELERLNAERMMIQNNIWDSVRVSVENSIKQGMFKNGIVVADSSWHEGVVGIVASRVTETFRRPAVVIAKREDFAKGSARSYGGRDVLAAIEKCKEHLLGFGGHRYAAGVSLAHENLDAFSQAFDAALANPDIGSSGADVAATAAASQELPLLIEGPCTIDDLEIQTLEEIERLGPFGPGNPEPVFSLKAQAVNPNVLKGRHLKLNLAAVQSGAPPKLLEAIWFNAAERESILDDIAGEEITEWAGVPELNRFRGRVTPTFRVRDWRRDWRRD